MTDVFKLIEANGLTLHGDIEHFAALVLANTDPQSSMAWQEGNEAGRLSEREACAKLVDHILKEGGGTWGDAIRARGEHMTKDERNFCSRCGKRTADLTTIHTCTPPQENT